MWGNLIFFNWVKSIEKILKKINIDISKREKIFLSGKIFWKKY